MEYKQTTLPLVDMKIMMTGLEKTISWSDVGILFDKQNKSTLILLLGEEFIVNGVLRFSLKVDENIEAVNLLKRGGDVFLGGADKEFAIE